jgi:hypothetical protein
LNWFDHPGRELSLEDGQAIDQELQELCLEVKDNEFLEFLSEMNPEQKQDLRDSLHISLFHKSEQSRIELGKCIERCWEAWHQKTAQTSIEKRGI